MSGLGPSAYASPASVTFSPTSGADSGWDVPAAVRVFGAALSSRRPVCRNGAHNCDHLEASRRIEVVSHALVSSDPRWNLGAVGASSDVPVHVAPQLDSADAPRVTSGRFSNLLNGAYYNRSMAWSVHKPRCCHIIHFNSWLLLHCNRPGRVV